MNSGAYGIVAIVRDVSTNAVLAKSSLPITIGEVKVKNYPLDVCYTWSVSSSGGQGITGQGMTTDVWDISMIPGGATFDVDFQMHDNPDKMLLEYPPDNLVLDTGESKHSH